MARRAVVNGPGKPLRLENCEIPEASSGKIRIRIAYAGMCRTELHNRDDQGTNSIFSVFGEENYKKVVPGHEISGYVDEIAADLDDKCPLKRGDKVIVYACVGCQQCPVCGRGQNNLCRDERSLLYTIGTHPSRPGGYQTHIVVDPKYVLKVPDGIPLQTACLLPCSAGTSYSAVSMLKDAVEFGSSTDESGKARILITGSGGLGLWAIRIARALYGNMVHITAADINQTKLDLARKSGADEVVLWSSTATADESALLVNRNGLIHGVIDFVGKMGTVSAGVKCLLRNGMLIVVGIEKDDITLPIALLVMKQITLRGCLIFDMHQLKALLDLMKSKNITYPDIETFSLDEVNVALDLLEKGEIRGRAVLKLG